jgi:hypothetical protein
VKSSLPLVVALATPGVNRFSVVLLPAGGLQKRFLQKNETHPSDITENGGIAQEHFVRRGG